MLIMLLLSIDVALLTTLCHLLLLVLMVWIRARAASLQLGTGGRGGGGLTSNALASTRGGLGKSSLLKQERSAEMAGNTFKTNMVW